MENIKYREPMPAIDGALPATTFVWRRYFARGFDLSIYEILWSVFQLLVLRWHPADNLFYMFLFGYISYSLMIFIEPLLLSTLGTTPGKAIFGLVVRNFDGSKLTYTEGLIRTFRLFASGFGFGIPLYHIYRLYVCCERAGKSEIMSWDYEDDINYQIKDKKFLRIIILIFFFILVSFAELTIEYQSKMPINRGSITPLEYVENINGIIKHPDLFAGFSMKADGHWYKDNADPTRYYHSLSGYDFLKATHKMTIENGTLTGVSFEINSDEQGKPIYGFEMQRLYITLAFLAAQRGVNCYDINFNSDIEEMLQNTFDNFDISLFGVRIVQNIDYDGYIISGDMLFPEKNVTPHFRYVFSMELENRFLVK